MGFVFDMIDCDRLQELKMASRARKNDHLFHDIFFFQGDSDDEKVA